MFSICSSFVCGKPIMNTTHYGHKVLAINIRFNKILLLITNKRKTMSNAVKKLKQDEKKVVLAYAMFKLKANRLAKELDTMKQNLIDVFDRTNQNLIIVQDEQGESFGLQKINRKRKKFETANFKIAHNDLYNKFTTELEYSEYKAIGDNNAQ